MNCPHCGDMMVSEEDDNELEWECGTTQLKTFTPLIARSADCYNRQISQLKAELAQSVRRDDPRLKEAMEIVAGMPMKAIFCPPVRQSREVCTLLQSIGK